MFIDSPFYSYPHLYLKSISLIFTKEEKRAIHVVPKTFSQLRLFKRDNTSTIRSCQNLDFSLATFGRGDKIYLWFGHTALAIPTKNRIVQF